MAPQDDFAADAGCLRVVDKDTSQPYYLTLDVHEHEDDLEQSSFDLQVTDGCRAWKVDGCARPPGTHIPDWFAHARRALQGGPEASRYTYYFGPAPGAEKNLRVAWGFEQHYDGVMAPRHRPKCILEPLSEPRELIRALLDSLLKNVKALQSIAQESQQQTRSAAKQVAEQQAQLASIAEQHNARMEELYIKFAAVLNEKKRKCQELQRALETAQATLQADEDEETDREDAAETTASGSLEEAGGDDASGDNAAGPSYMDIDTQPMDFPAAPERSEVKAEPADSPDQRSVEQQPADAGIPPQIKIETGEFSGDNM